MKDMKLVYLEWQDAHELSTSWETQERMESFLREDDFMVQQVGFIYKETKHFILFCSQYVKPGKHVGEGYGMVLKIPNTWIKKRIDLTKYIK